MSGQTCMDVNLHTATTGYTWELVQCSTTDEYSISGTYTEKCCIPNGNHVLSCHSGQNNDWVNAVVGIDGHKFCDDMIGHEKFVAINIPGTNSSTNIFTHTYTNVDI